MKRQYAQITCDSCMDKVIGESYTVPDGWAEVNVRIGKVGEEAIHFCQPCWENGKPLKRNDIPLLIRRFFGWVVKKPEGEEGANE